MHAAPHHAPPAAPAGFALDPGADLRAVPVALGRAPDGRPWLAWADAPRFLDWAWQQIGPRSPLSLTIVVGEIVAERLRLAPELTARFADAERLATCWVDRIAPGRDRFRALYRGLSDARSPASRALRVATLIAGVARQRALARASQIKLVLAGLCLDLGAWLLPDDTSDRVRARHPLLGADLLGAHGVRAGLLVAGVSGHHERFDGQGTPVGLMGAALPLAARITGLCDRAVEVMTPPAVGPVLPRYLALERLADDRGAHDPALLVDLVRLFARRDARW